MRLTFTPEGLGPVVIGSTREEAHEALASWGPAKPFARGDDPSPGWVLHHPVLSFFVYCDSGATIEAIELSRPNDPTTTVTFDDIDLFTDPADVVTEAFRRRGHEVLVEDGGYDVTLPAVLLAMRRDGDPTDPRTDLPMYFGSALIARPGYYD